MEVKPAPFYPDFLAFINGKWVIVNVKGKHLAETKQIDDRKKALKLLEKKGLRSRRFKALTILPVLMNYMKNSGPKFLHMNLNYSIRIGGTVRANRTLLSSGTVFGGKVKNKYGYPLLEIRSPLKVSNER